MVPLDEDRLARHRTAVGEPGRKVARAIVLSSRLVYSVGIGPDAEVSNVQHPLEPAAERVLEREDVVVESTNGSMNVARSTEKHPRSPFVANEPLHGRAAAGTRAMISRTTSRATAMAWSTSSSAGSSGIPG